MCLTYRPFEWTDDDVEAYVDIANSGEPGSLSVDEVREHQSRIEPETYFCREFVEVGGERIGVATCAQETQTAFDVGVRLLPDHRGAGHEARIYSRLIQMAKDRGAGKVTCYVPESREECSAALRSLGFERILRDATAILDLERFDPAPFEPYVKEVERQGVALRSIAELVAAGVDWAPNYHRLHAEVMRDVPLPEPAVEGSLEDFRKWTETAHILAGSWVVAIDGERWVGLSILTGDVDLSDTAMAALTGVVRSHRRRGIATALKVAAITAAKKAGIRKLEAINEEHNPMLQLNLRLGFREVDATLIFRKDL